MYPKKRCERLAITFPNGKEAGIDSLPYLLMSSARNGSAEGLPISLTDDDAQRENDKLLTNHHEERTRYGRRRGAYDGSGHGESSKGDGVWLMQERNSWEYGSITGSKVGVRKTTRWVRVDRGERVKVGFRSCARRKIGRSLNAAVKRK